MKLLVLICIMFVSLYCGSSGEKKSSELDYPIGPSENGTTGEFGSENLTFKETVSIQKSYRSMDYFSQMIQRNYKPNYYFINPMEMINYFEYSVLEPEGSNLFSIATESSISPWNPDNQLVFIMLGTKKEIPVEEKIKNHYILAIDTSGSMGENLELAKKNMKEIVSSIQQNEKLSIIEYKTNTELLLSPSFKSGNELKIYNKIENLQVGGGTNSWPAIQQAFLLAKETKEGYVPKIIVFSDGDFGGVNETEFKTLMKKQKNVDFKVMEYGIISDPFIDSLQRDGFVSTVIYERNKTKSLNLLLDKKADSIGEDLKLQIEFDPRSVSDYRIFGPKKIKKGKGSDSNRIMEIPVYKNSSYVFILEVAPKNKESKNDIFGKFKISYSQSGKEKTEKGADIRSSSKEIWDCSENFRFATGVLNVYLDLQNQSFVNKKAQYLSIHLLQDSANYDPHKKKNQFLFETIKLKSLLLDEWF